MARKERKTNANPEVRDASNLNPTQEEVKAELAKHSKIEQETGVAPEELDTRPVVDADPGNGKSFRERTQELQPWAKFQEEQVEAEDKRAQQIAEDNAEAAKEKN